jgi:WD40 repeat protein
MYASLKFSPDGKKVISSSNKNNGTVWDAATGKLLFNLKTQGQINALHSVVISPNDKWILIVMENGSINLWEAATGKIINSFTGYHPFVWENNYADFVLINHPRYTQFSPDEKFIITYQNRDTACLWDVKTCQFLCSFTKEGKQLKVAANKNILFDKGQKKILVITGSDTASLDLSKLGLHDISLSGSDDQKLVDYTGREPITEWKSAELKHFNFLNCGEGSCSPYLGEIGICFAHHSNWAVTVSNDNTIKIRDTTSGKILYSFLSIDSSDYLAVDNAGHYDGTQAARKLLYFTCGLEVISLDQVKDQLWVPNLIERINNKEIINAKTLNELNICGLTPEVKEVSSNPDEYYFTIKPRRGGLGDLNLSINGVVADTRKPEQLTKKDDVYELRIIKKDFIPYLPDGQINKISLKVYTADNAISSQEITITIDKTEKPTPPPSLFAVMVGVSDYKGEAMDLDFAAIDATDVSNALKDAAGKLLGKEHVFMYNLTTAKDHYLLPEKNSIKKVLEEIGEKATANDILFIFLSGHGVMEGEGKKLFYYMTADAADFDAYTVAGISTTELTEWIKPQNIKAQKRILILDACHSGQAINDFVKLGDDKLGIPASKGDGKAQQIKAIDKLNEKSGLFILSASASDKSAFESKIHSHGYLTYSLLKAIKEQPDILEDGKFLNISRWFNAAGKTVSEVAKEEGVGQQTQIVSNTDFNIGLVDDEVMGNIKLPEGTLVFSASNFQNNDVAADGDDLEMSRTINQSLQESSSNEIIYSATASSANAYSLSGRYDVKDNTVTISFSIKKNNKTLFRFEKEAGPKDKLRELADTVVTKAVEWVISNKENK